MISRLITILLFVLFNVAQASGQYSVAGKITNANGETLEAASAFIVWSNNIATISDYAGRYLLENVPHGEQMLKVTYLGYKDEEKAMFIEQDELIDVL